MESIPNSHDHCFTTGLQVVFGFSKHQDQRLRVVLPDKALPLLYQTVHYLPTSLLCVSVKKVIPPLACNAHSHS